MFKENLFENKTVLVTGGGSGIGYAIAKQFLHHGAHVYIGSRKPERLDAALQNLAQYGNCTAFPLDIRDTDQIEQAALTIKQQSGKLDILINNAGGQFPSIAEDISYKGWKAVVDTNLNGTWFVTQNMYKTFFAEQGHGTIVNIIANIYRGFAGMAHTGAARAGVANLTQSLAVEWAQKGININAIAPGIINSSGLEQYPPELKQGIADNIPQKRLGTTDEVAQLALFLASPMAAYITGETIYIDGGQRLWGDIWKY